MAGPAKGLKNEDFKTERTILSPEVQDFNGMDLDQAAMSLFTADLAKALDALGENDDDAIASYAVADKVGMVPEMCLWLVEEVVWGANYKDVPSAQRDGKPIST